MTNEPPVYQFMDWKNPDQYAFLLDAKPEIWAWEFLRRNTAYQAEYNQFMNDNAEADANGTIPYHYEPARNEGESLTRWQRRIIRDFDVDPVRIPLRDYLAKKWRVADLYDPRKSWSVKNRFLKVKTSLMVIKDQEDFDRHLSTEFVGSGQGEPPYPLVSPSKFIIAFDLSCAIGPQVKKAEILLKKNAKIFGKVIHGNTKPKSSGLIKADIRHLRILDAFNAKNKPTVDDIFKYIPSPKDFKRPEEKVRRWKQDAKLASEKYLRFLTLK